MWCSAGESAGDERFSAALVARDGVHACGAAKPVLHARSAFLGDWVARTGKFGNRNAVAVAALTVHIQQHTPRQPARLSQTVVTAAAVPQCVGDVPATARVAPCTICHPVLA
jgi:hypothetical protein